MCETSSFTLELLFFIIFTSTENGLDFFFFLQRKYWLVISWGEFRIFMYKRNNEALSTCLDFNLQIFLWWRFELCEGFSFCSLFSSYPGAPANDFWGSVPGSAGQVFHLKLHLVWSLFLLLSPQSLGLWVLQQNSSRSGIWQSRWGRAGWLTNVNVALLRMCTEGHLRWAHI